MPGFFNVHFSFGFLMFCVLTTTIETKQSANGSCNPKSCHKDIENEKPICGSDGITYPNRCLFEKLRCQSTNVTLTRRGPCKPPTPCSQLKQIQQTLNGFEPKCRNDGSFDSAQCHPTIGYCWCVTPQGIPLPYTAVRRRPDQKQRCGKATTRRRSSSSPNRKKNKVCKQRDKAIFNNNLIDTFQTDISLHSDSARNNGNVTFVVGWKFNSLDKNHDGILDKIEYRDLKRIAKKAIKPKRCAKLFIQACDLDADQRISRGEWTECLTRDGMDDGRTNSPATEDYNGGADADEEDDGSFFNRSPPDGVLSPEPPVVVHEEESIENREDEPTDCLSDRKTALNEENQLYVPDCTPDGRYQKVQCYKSAGYCWCVHEDTGKNIPGTSVKNNTPKCDQLSPAISRPMKGCAEDKKLQFLKDLVGFIHEKMSSNLNNTNTIPLTWPASREEHAASWSFVILDKNKNKMLERNEWKIFKEWVQGVKGLKKCGKKLPRYCDINKDRMISMTEWLECLNVVQQQGQPTTASQQSASQAGKNTLSMLKED